MSYGRFFEELEVGQRFRHWPGRTIAEFDDTLFSLLSMNQHPLHIDEQYAAGTQHARRLVVGPLVIALAVGMSQADIGGNAIAEVEYRDIEHTGPVFHGDTLYAESTVLDKRETDGIGGLVTIETRVANERGEAVLRMKRTIIARRRGEI